MGGDVKFEGTQEEWDALVDKNKIIGIAAVCHQANKAWCEIMEILRKKIGEKQSNGNAIQQLRELSSA